MQGETGGAGWGTRRGWRTAGNAGTAVGVAAGSSGSSAWLAGFPAGIWGGPGEGVWSGRGLDPSMHGQDHPSAPRVLDLGHLQPLHGYPRRRHRTQPNLRVVAGGALSEFKRPPRPSAYADGRGGANICGRQALAWASIAEPGRSRQMTESTDIAMCPVPPVSGDGYGRA